MIWLVLRLKVEPFKDVFPYGLLTMIVSFEAIFLSTFMMTSQNRADVKRQVLADHERAMIQDEERQKQQLLLDGPLDATHGATQPSRRRCTSL